jgi:hypothetical protein
VADYGKRSALRKEPIFDSFIKHYWLVGWLSKNCGLQGLVFFSGAKAYGEYVEVLKKRRNTVGRAFLRRHQSLTGERISSKVTKDAFAKTHRMAKQKFRPTRLGGFSGVKAYI